MVFGRYGNVPGKITRSAVAARLGVTPEAVRAMRERGDLTAEKVDNVWWFDVAAVERFARTYRHKADRVARRADANLAVRAYKLFDDGVRSMREAVVKLRASPAQIARLFELWKRDDLDAHANTREVKQRGDGAARGRRRLKQIAELLEAQAERRAVQKEEDPVDAAYRKLAEGVPTYGPVKKKAKPN